MPGKVTSSAVAEGQAYRTGMGAEGSDPCQEHTFTWINVSRVKGRGVRPDMTSGPAILAS
jgi:hypothetical protein